MGSEMCIRDSFSFGFTIAVAISKKQSLHISFLISGLFLLLLSSLNDSQYDGKVIADEEAVSKQRRIEQQIRKLIPKLV